MIKLRKSQDGFSIAESFIVLIVLVLICGAGWYAYKQHQSKPNPMPKSSTATTKSQTPAKHGSKVVSLDNTYDQYINYNLGINLTYSKEVEAEVVCQGTAPQIDIAPAPASVEVYPDTAHHKFFVAASKFVTTVSHQIGPGTYQGRDSCTVNDTTLQALENPVSSISESSQPLSVEFDYATVASASDLDAFVASRVPTGMIIDHSVHPSRSGNTYTYPFKYTGTAEDPPAARWYFLIYDPDKKLAVYWVTPNTQFPAWQGTPNSTGDFSQVNTPNASIL